MGAIRDEIVDKMWDENRVAQARISRDRAAAAKRAYELRNKSWLQHLPWRNRLEKEPKIDG